MTVRFKFLTGDVDWLEYGGTWISQKFSTEEFDYWLVRHIINWEETQGCVEEDGKYNVMLSIVAPELFEDKSKISDGKSWREMTNQEKVLKVYEYSGGAYVADWNGYGYQKLFKICAEEADHVVQNIEIYLQRPINKIGSTGKDFLKGDVLAGLKRV